MANDHGVCSLRVIIWLLIGKSFVLATQANRICTRLRICRDEFPDNRRVCNRKIDLARTGDDNLAPSTGPAIRPASCMPPDRGADAPERTRRLRRCCLELMKIDDLRPAQRLARGGRAALRQLGEASV
jgi:hypothetical protein